LSIAASLGLGWVALALPLAAGVGVPLAARTAISRGAQGSPASGLEALALACAGGLLVNLLLGLCIADLRIVLLLDLAVAAAAIAWLALTRKVDVPARMRPGAAESTMVALVLLAFAGPILLEPLQAWDARSLWFFQAKLIHVAGGLDPAHEDWINPAYAFVHADYPKLLPLLAAQIADAAGHWNEFVPKGALLLLLAPAVLGLGALTVARPVSAAAVFLFGTFLLGCRELLWNGYADGYLALYAGVASLFLARWVDGRRDADLALGVAFIGVALSLKNEGMLLALCAVVSVAGFVALDARRPPARALIRSLTPAAPYAALAVLGCGAWTLAKSRFALPNDLDFGLASLHRAWTRAGSGELVPIARAVFGGREILSATGLLLLSATLCTVFGAPLRRHVWLPACAALCYLAGLFAVYACTPQDLRWHLATSAERTVLAGVLGILASVYLCLTALQQRLPNGRVVEPGAMA
jgi:hypothetical protein